MKRIPWCLVGIMLLLLPSPARAREGIIFSRHNLSITGPGEIKALPGADPLERVCIYCHTPHNAAPRTPLWNKAIKPVSYVPYKSSTMGAKPSQPGGPSRLCLSCHDGTLALGALLLPTGGISTTGEIAPGKTTYLGVVLTGDHPVTFSYNDSIANPLAGLSPVPPKSLLFYSNSTMHCSTCHDPHEDAYQSVGVDGRVTGKFLLVDNRSSGLCVKCHTQMEGWFTGGHRNTTSLQPVDGLLPVPPKKWPAWKTVAEWGCESCHTPHSAAGPQRLMYFAEEERNCYLCHDGSLGMYNIKRQFQKASVHPVDLSSSLHDPMEKPELITNRHVECADCHNPHATRLAPASPPMVSGMLDKVSGVNVDRVGVYPATNEYEICFKCHADWAPRFPLVTRVLNSTNTRTQFSLLNPSYHPVVGSGKNPDVPSIPSPDNPLLTTSSVVYCTDCHGDDAGGSRGPHGSSYRPILRFRYDTADTTPESLTVYYLCYRCHNRQIIRGDVSFPHSEHLDAGATCSACHDPHGIVDDFRSGSHTHLINFDTTIVRPIPPDIVPVFTDTGRFSGSCTLVCHGEQHNNASYGPSALAPSPLKPFPQRKRKR